MKTRLISLILAVLVCVGLFAGCQSSELRSYSEDAAEESAAAASTDSEATTKDYTPAYEAYDPDEIMLTVNEIDVTWSELFYWYVYDVSNMENYYGEITDWDDESSFASGKTNREYVMENALDTVKHYCALESKAKDMGITLTEEDKAALQTTWENNVESYGNGDEATFIEYLDKAYLSRELYNHINEVSLLYTRVLENVFGANGEKLSESEILEKSADMGYVRVKHILISTKDDTGTTLPDEQLAEKKATAENLVKELKGISDRTELEKRFDELVAEHGSDPGTEYYTEGYTFIPGNGSMDTNFETAAGELSDYEVSEIVETAHGYHILLRMPLSTTATVEYASVDSKTTLGYYVAQDMFGAETDNWANESTIVLTKTYEKMDVAKVFAKAKSVAAAS